MLNLGQESHFEFPSGLVDLEKLFEALFEDRVAKRVSHHVVASSRVEAGFHFEDTNLIKSSHKQINNYSCLLCTCSQILVVFDSLLKMLSIVFFLLYIKVRTNLFLQSLRNNHAWAICDRATDKSHYSRPSRSTTCCFKQTDTNVESSSHASLGSETIFYGPGVRLQIVQNGVKSEFTFTDGHKESFDGSVVSFIQRIR